MPPKTGLNDKENDMETENQLSNNNEEVNQNLIVDPTKLDSELKFKLNFNIRDKLIAILNDYTSLLYGDKNKEKVIEKADDLMHDFVHLSLKIDKIKENVINQVEQLRPTLIINSKMKTEITDLLIKNKNYFILFNDNKDVKLNLINENNNLVIKLMQFPIEMLKEDDPIDNDYVWKRVLINESNHTADDLLMAKSEFEQKICELKEKISILNDQLVAKSKFDEEEANYKKEILELKEKISNSNALSTNKKETATHFLSFQNHSGRINSLPFECLGLEFIINIQNSNDYFNFELALLNKLDINKKVKATCELILIYNNNMPNKSLQLNLIFTQNQLFQSKEKVHRDQILKVVKMKVNLTVEFINL